MKSLLVASFLSAVAALAGCASQTAAPALAPVGPPPAFQPAIVNTKGRLVVFSAMDSCAHFNSLPYSLFYTSYQILSADGKWLQSIQNNPSSSVPGPIEVELPAGTYQVKAHANGYGVLTVPVVVSALHTTTLHLEGGGGWRNRAALAQANPVRLPDGRIVGWRAESADLSRVRP